MTDCMYQEPLHHYWEEPYRRRFDGKDTSKMYSLQRWAIRIDGYKAEMKGVFNGLFSYMYLIIISGDTVRLTTYSWGNEWEVKGDNLYLYNGTLEYDYTGYVKQKLRNYVRIPYCYLLIKDSEERYFPMNIFRDNWVALDMKMIKKYIWGDAKEKYSIWDKN